ncbi:WYL domain-containing protein [Shewanella glacialipiscicola]|uniref:helix-turn-helix transcriptional regulator n=1 Tax=Shewanella glacialipiscicola TaxID=614069 RepID=UPI0021D8A5D9|nr:WYL domain-containing protein [Shewanella glacialipiscicola]MCU7995255.1 WYL domain-containing protein [Shewanella glacialipiscicola]MCU8026598.1 WYL domain-containing protein [Shewanella glacialipiscicola]
MTTTKELDPVLAERYRFIDFLLLFKGQLTRAELVKRFSIGEATASRTIASFLEKYPEEVEYLGPRYGYRANPFYQYKYEHNAVTGLQYTAYGTLTQTLDVQRYGIVINKFAKQLDVANVAPVCRAIVNNASLHIQYASTTSGIKDRVVNPHSIFEAGGFWYFRAYDKSAYEFRTFKLSRVIKVFQLHSDSSNDYSKARDDSWNRQRMVELMAHPRNPIPDAQLSDIGIKDGEYRSILVSEALIGFVLNDMRVDCSTSHKLNFIEYPLALKNRTELLSVESMLFAPGFTSSTDNRSRS